MAGGLGGLDFLEQKVNRYELSGMALLAQPFAYSDGEMSFAETGFSLG